MKRKVKSYASRLVAQAMIKNFEAEYARLTSRKVVNVRELKELRRLRQLAELLGAGL